jgi:hypothetical protein
MVKIDRYRPSPEEIERQMQHRREEVAFLRESGALDALEEHGARILQYDPDVFIAVTEPEGPRQDIPVHAALIRGLEGEHFISPDVGHKMSSFSWREVSVQPVRERSGELTGIKIFPAKDPWSSGGLATVVAPANSGELQDKLARAVRLPLVRVAEDFRPDFQEGRGVTYIADIKPTPRR